MSEITFGETAAGAATVMGQQIGNNQRHANSMGGTMRGLGGLESKEKTIWKGTDEIRKLIGALHLRQSIEDQAVQLYKLANSMSFVQGRRIRNVAACCIYLTDRRQAESTLLLMDLAEKIHVNIWVLGDTYKKFLKAIYADDPSVLPDGQMKLPQLEPLILKFCRKLEFGEDSWRVAEDACKLMKRMKRDWMIEGRQPAGICGACIILAARMNNFRRTVREVVYVCRVADSTINQRLYEFKRTKASTLTVKQFREFGVQLKDDIQPPSVYRREEKEAKKRKRALGAAGEEDITADADVVLAGPNSSAPKPKRVTKKRKTAKDDAQPTATAPEGSSQGRRDDDGFLIPDIPINPDATEEDTLNFDNDAHLEYVAAATAPEEGQNEDGEEAVPVPKKRGRPRKKHEPIVIPQEDLEIEAEIEEDLQQSLTEWHDIFSDINDQEDPENHPVFKAANARARTLVYEFMPNGNVCTDEEVGDDEFDNDPDVMNCVCTEAEIQVREKVWVTENAEWLRDQQEKILREELDRATNGKKKKPKARRRFDQMGDGSVLGGKAAASPRDAVAKMIKKRASHFSSHIDYDRLKDLYNGADDEAGVVTPAGSGLGASPAVSGTSGQAQEKAKEALIEKTQDHGDEEAEGDYEEEYTEQQDYEEEFDDPAQYMDDDDVGFDEADLNDDF